MEKMSTAYQKEVCLHQTSFKSMYSNIGSLKLTRNQVVNLSQVRLPYDQNQHEHKKTCKSHSENDRKMQAVCCMQQGSLIIK